MNTVLDGGTVVLVDTNTIIEAHRTGTWPALSGGYRIETVEECVTETQTGFQRRRREETIVAKELRASMASVHAVGDRERAELAVRVPDIWLDGWTRAKPAFGPMWSVLTVSFGARKCQLSLSRGAPNSRLQARLCQRS